MVALLLAETLLVFVFFFPTCSALLCLSGCALYHSQHPTHPCASADHFTKFSVIGIGLVDLFSPTGLDDFFVVFLSELLSITFSLFISVSYHIFHETLFVMFQRLKMGGVEMFHQLDLNGIETECPKVFQHCLSAKTTGLDLILTAWAAKEVVQLETELPQGVAELWMTTSQIGVDRTGR